jgi:cytosine/adenosine deaminase-related metal-dependent hydrolase
MLGWARPVSFVNAQVVVPGGVASRLRFASTVLALDSAPRRGDIVIDLDGACVFPGLINAHDHLELNHFGPLRPRAAYTNASDWIDDLAPIVRDDPRVRQNVAHPLKWRLFVGGLKNILSGVTTVAHHNPRYREIRDGFPVHVLKKYRWAHSFYLQGKPVGAKGERGGVTEHAAAAPVAEPFMVHLGEGVDDRARAELAALESGGGLRANTVLVHGVAITAEEWRRAIGAGASLVWCPASNEYLFGSTVKARRFIDAHPDALAHMAIATDSRLTGARDLLDEMRVARAAGGVSADELLAMATTSAARVLKLPRAGRIAVGGAADLLVLPRLAATPAETLLAATRRDVSLVVLGGRPMVGTSALSPVFAARRVATRPIVIDGADRLVESRLGSALARCPIREEGVECP